MNKILITLFTLSSCWLNGMLALRSSQSPSTELRINSVGDHKSDMPQAQPGISEIDQHDMQQSLHTTTTAITNKSTELAPLLGSISIDIKEAPEPIKKIAAATLVQKKVAQNANSSRKETADTYYAKIGAHLISLGISNDIQPIIFNYLVNQWYNYATFDVGIHQWDACMAPDGTYFYITDGLQKKWNIDGKHTIENFELPPETIQIAFSPNGKYIAARSTRRDRSCIFEKEDNSYKKIREFNVDFQPFSFAPRAAEILFSHDSAFFILYAGWRDGIQKYDIANGTNQQLLPVKSLTALAIAPDDQSIAYAETPMTITEPTMLTVFEISSQKIIDTCDVSDARIIYSIIFSPDGSKIIAGTACGLIVWDLKLRTAQRTADSKAIDQIVSLQNNLICAHDQKLCILHNFFPACDVSHEHERLDTMKVFDSIAQLSVTPDNKTFLSLTSNGLVKIWKKKAVQEIVQEKKILAPVQSPYTLVQKLGMHLRANAFKCATCLCYASVPFIVYGLSLTPLFPHSGH